MSRKSSGQARDGEVRQSADTQVMEKSKRQASGGEEGVICRRDTQLMGEANDGEEGEPSK